jgi:hypothetical protein
VIRPGLNLLVDAANRIQPGEKHPLNKQNPLNKYNKEEKWL